MRRGGCSGHHEDALGRLFFSIGNVKHHSPLWGIMEGLVALSDFLSKLIFPSSTYIPKCYVQVTWPGSLLWHIAPETLPTGSLLYFLGAFWLTRTRFPNLCKATPAFFPCFQYLYSYQMSSCWGEGGEMLHVTCYDPMAILLSSCGHLNTGLPWQLPCAGAMSVPQGKSSDCCQSCLWLSVEIFL